MKTSEMTNEELAKHIECGDAILREAAARLRTFTLLSKAHQRLANDSVDYESNLLRKLNVAEDALVKMSATACAHCDLRDACQEGEDGIIVPCNDMIAIRRALAAIREEGGTDAD